MLAANLDTLPSELSSYICELVYLSHKPSLSALTLVNKNYETAASKFLFREVFFSHDCLDERQIRSCCETWETLLTRRECLESVRYLYLQGALLPNGAPRLRIGHRKVPEAEEWQEANPEEFIIHEPVFSELNENMFLGLAQLLEKLFRLERLHWAAMQQVPHCILAAMSDLRVDLRLEMPEWRLQCLARGGPSQSQISLITCPSLRNITAEVVAEDMNKDVLLRMLGGLSPALEEVRIIKCETLFSPIIDASRDHHRTMWQDVCERCEPKKKSRLKQFSVHGKDPVSQAELEQWFDAADMSSLQRLELRSGVDSADVWNSTIRAEYLPHLRELVLGFDFECTSEKHDAALEWIQNLYKVHGKQLHALELCGNIAPKLVKTALDVHGRALRKITISPQAHSGVFTLMYFPRDLKNLNASSPSLEELTIPLTRGQTIGNEHQEAQNYAAFSQFANLTYLHILLDCSRWGEVWPVWMLQGSQDEAFDEQTYISLDGSRITYRHVWNALVTSATDESLAKSIWSLVTAHKVGLPLHELYIQPYGGMEIIRGFRPDDRPELAGQLVDLYAMLREVSRSYKFARHIRDDVAELVVREPSDALPRGYWSKVGEQERMLGEVICRPHGMEMEIFRRIWPCKPGNFSWRDDWHSLELPMQKV